MIKQIVLIFCFLSFAAISKAAVWENIPAFPQAERIRQEETLVNNSPARTTVYSTLASPEEIVKFYKTKLINFGWKLETEANQQGIEMLMFSKGDKFLNIMLQSILGKNFITLAQSINPKELLKQKPPCPECEKKQEELNKGIEPARDLISKDENFSKKDTPGRDLQFVPRYPGAVRASAMERENGKKVNLSYYSQSSVEDVVNFYRQNMGNYYWQLDNQIDFQNLPEGLAEKIPVNINGQSLVFKSSSASCIISITEEPQSKGTIIGVNYNEK